MSLLEVRNLSRNLKPKFAQVSFRLDAGECLALVGANGSGKTTLLRAILGLIKYQGEVIVSNSNISRMSRTDISRHIAYVPQVLESHCELIVDDYLNLSFFNQEKIDFKRKLDAISLLGIDKLLKQNFNNLSGGEKQKVLIASAYCQKPSLYLFDEPFSALDIFSVSHLLKVFSRIRVSGAAIIVALHDLNLVLKCSEQVLQVESGKLILANTYVANCNEILASCS